MSRATQEVSRTDKENGGNAENVLPPNQLTEHRSQRELGNRNPIIQNIICHRKDRTRHAGLAEK